jgi:hypothetical protein
MPFYAKRGMTAHGYGELVWQWLVLNRKPHSHWEQAPSSPAVSYPAPP